MIKFNQKALLKRYMKMKTKHRKNAKIEFEKNFFKLMDNVKTMANAQKYRNIKVLTKYERR